MMLTYEVVLYLFYGALLNVINSIGIYFTIRKYCKDRNFKLAMLCSSMIRILFLMLAFYLLMNNNLKKLLIMLIGFSITKVFMIILIKRKKNEH